MLRLNKDTVYQLEYAHAVVTAGRMYAEQITEGYCAFAGTLAPDPWAVRAHFDSCCTLLESAAANYEHCSLELLRDQAEDAAARGERDRRLAALKRAMSSARDRVRDGLGQEQLGKYGMDQAPPKRSRALVLYAGQVHTLLEKHPQTGTDPLGTPIDTANFARAIGEALDGYRAASDLVHRERKETQQARIEKEVTEERFRIALSGVAAYVDALMRMAGLEAQAKRVRPSRGRTSGASDDPPATPEDTGAPDSTGVSSPAGEDDSTPAR